MFAYRTMQVEAMMMMRRWQMMRMRMIPNSTMSKLTSRCLFLNSMRIVSKVFGWRRYIIQDPSFCYQTFGCSDRHSSGIVSYTIQGSFFYPYISLRRSWRDRETGSLGHLRGSTWSNWSIWWSIADEGPWIHDRREEETRWRHGSRRNRKLSPSCPSACIRKGPLQSTAAIKDSACHSSSWLHSTAYSPHCSSRLFVKSVCADNYDFEECALTIFTHCKCILAYYMHVFPCGIFLDSFASYVYRKLGYYHPRAYNLPFRKTPIGWLRSDLVAAFSTWKRFELGEIFQLENSTYVRI